MADHLVPDYELDETLPLGTEQLRTAFEETRSAILDLLAERSATTSQLAEALNRPKGTVGHHCKALEEAGLIRVVRTRKVRAVEEKYYGRTARTFLLNQAKRVLDTGPSLLIQEALDDLAQASDVDRLAGKPGTATVRRARIPDDRAAEWVQRLHALMDEFITQPRAGDTSYGFVAALYPTARPVLPEEE